MNANEHSRAMDLLTLHEVEGISDTDASWLAVHLESCADCAAFESALSEAEQAVRSVTVMASAGLVQTTQAKVHARAEQLREQQARRVLISVSFCLGVLTSTLTAWIWWKCGAWVADRLGLPSGIVEPGVLLFWLLPAVAMAILLVALPPAAWENTMMYRLMKERARGVE